MSTHDRRREARIPFVADVEYVLDDVRFCRRATDLSATGIYIEDSAPPPAGTPVEVKFELEGYPIVAQGRVVQCQPPIGFGIELETMDPGDRELVSLHVMSQVGLVGV